MMGASKRVAELCRVLNLFLFPLAKFLPDAALAQSGR